VKHSSPDPEELDRYKNAGFSFVRLQSKNKIPLDTGWRHTVFSFEDAVQHMEHGGNVGWRLGPTDLVIDVDPRNFIEDDNPLLRLTTDFHFDLEAYPHVMTGSGGHHYYLSKPPDCLILDSLPKYQGVEFKAEGRQVVIPGSLHPCGSRYLYDDLGPDPWDRLPVPEILLSAIQRPTIIRSVSGGGELTPEQVAILLQLIPVDKYREQHAWLNIMLACHHASLGNARAEFIAWSTADGPFHDHTDRIGRRWDSLHADTIGPRVTYRTLYALVQSHKGTIPWETAEHDFDDGLAPDDIIESDDKGKKELLGPAVARLAQMNTQHCVVNGSSVQVWTKSYDPELHRSCWLRQSPRDFDIWYANDCINLPRGRTQTKAAWWLRHAERRSYLGVVFMPEPEVVPNEYLNMWTGPSVKPTQALWDMFEELIREAICDNNESFYTYIMNWMAYLMQWPGRRAEVALVLRGPKGTGKGTVGRALQAIFQSHALHVSSAEHFTGRFNAHLRDLVYIFVDEAFWAGDRRSEGTLKRLITEPTLVYEGKGRDVVQGPNRISVLIASNEQWVVPAGLDGERRYAIFDITNTQQNNSTFFYRLEQQMYKHGGLGGLYGHLLNRDIKDWHPRDNIPQTQALQEQKIQGLSPIDAWWLTRLTQGTLPLQRSKWSQTDGTLAPISALYRDYLQETTLHGLRTRPVYITVFGASLKKLIPYYSKKQVRVHEHEAETVDYKSRMWMAVIPSLSVCRKAFEQGFGEIEWESPDDE